MTTDLQKAALDYIETTQPVVEAYEHLRSDYRTKAAAIAPKLVELGCVDPANLAKFTEKLASDPSEALSYLVKIAQLNARKDADIGESVQKQASAVSKDEAFLDRWI